MTVFLSVRWTQKRRLIIRCYFTIYDYANLMTSSMLKQQLSHALAANTVLFTGP